VKPDASATEGVRKPKNVYRKSPLSPAAWSPPQQTEEHHGDEAETRKITAKPPVSEQSSAAPAISVHRKCSGAPS
jgi:hypothetical protein